MLGRILTWRPDGGSDKAGFEHRSSGNPRIKRNRKTVLGVNLGVGALLPDLRVPAVTVRASR